MRALVVYCHPVPESYCAALRDAVVETLGGRGCEIRLVDLYAEGFDPVMSCDERRTYDRAAPADPVLQAHAAHLEWADTIVFVYPTWWYGLPAMLKGWLERVWATDVAFRLDGRGGMVPLMGNISKLAVVTSCGAPLWWSYVVGHPGRKLIMRGVRSLCARRCRTLFLAHYLMDISTPESRAAFLAKVRRRLAVF